MRRLPRLVLAAACLPAVGLSCISVGPASAQQPREPPGAIERRFEEPPQPRARPPLAIPETERAVPPPGAERINFVLKDVRLEGNTVLSREQLRTQWARYLEQRISLTTVYEIAAALTVYYRNAGYILSRAIVPPQEITDGVVEIEIIEGYIDTVTIDGEPTGWKAQVLSKIEKIKAARPLHVAVMERYMLLINDLAGVSAQSVLRPSPTVTGASELIIVFDETLVNASASFDNRGTRFVGPLQLTATLNLSNVLGLYDATELRLIGARGTEAAEKNELRFVSLAHTELLSTEGTALKLEAARTVTNPGDNLRSSDIEGKATRLAATVTHPFIRTRADNLSAKFGFAYLDSETTLLNTPFFEDRIRWFTAGATFDFVDRFRGINLLSLNAFQGVNVLDAKKSGSADLSRAAGRSDFTKLTADVVREQNLGTGLSLVGAVTGQYAFSQLLASQEFGFGGKDFGRGYDPFEISGDHGAAVKLELRYGGPAEMEILESYQLFGFVDYGAVWRIDEDRDTGGARDTASSGGVGFRLNITPNFFGSLEVAQPITRRPTSNRDDGKRRPRVFFRITARI